MISINNKTRNHLKYRDKYYYSSFAIILVITILFICIYRDHKRNLYLNVSSNLQDNSKEYTEFFDKELMTNLSYLEVYGDLITEYIDEETGEIKDSEFSYIFKKSNEGANVINLFYYISDITGIGLNAKGEINPEYIVMDLRRRDWYKKAIIADSPIVSDVYLDSDEDMYCITISYAIRKNGEILGVLAGDIFLDNLKDYYFDMNEKDNLYVTVVSPNGRVIMDQNKEFLGRSFSRIVDNNDEFKENLNNTYSWRELLDSYPNNVEFTNNDGEYIYSCYNTSEVFGWTVFCLAKDSIIKHNLNRYRTILILIGILCCFVLQLFLHTYFGRLDRYDKLTGLLKFNEFFRYLKNSNKLSKEIELLFVSISNFDIVKTHYTNKPLETIIKEYTKVLKLIIGTDGKISISSEGIFIISFNTKKREYELIDITNKIRDQLTALELKNYDIINPEVVFISVRFTDVDFETLINDIQLVENAIKENQYNIKEFVSMDMEDLIQETQDTATKLKTLKKAIKLGEIFPFYQPIYNLENNKIAKFEVLMRLRSNGDFLSPYPYVLVGEKYNLIEEMDLMILEKALQYKKEIDYADELVFSFNLSGTCLNNANYLQKANGLVLKYGISPNKIEFEITETATIKHKCDLADTIKKYIDMGYSFSLDDFGVANSNLDYIKNIPCSYVKIDGSFIKDINKSSQNLYIVKSIIMMARAFDKKIVAEFIENENVYKCIKELDIDLGQGYYFGKPSRFIEIKF